MPNKEEIKKAVESLVDETLNASGEPKAEDKEVAEKSKENAPEAKTDDVEKSMPTALDENGGKDKIKSGVPYTEQGEGKPASSDESHSKSQKSEAKKSEENEDEKEDKVEKAEEKKETKKCNMKKSIEELSEHLTDDELELIKAWRDELNEEKKEEAKVEEKPSEDIAKSVQDAVSLQLESITKALSEKDDLIKSLSDKIEKLSEKPAYDKRSLENLETIEKSEEATSEISKAQVLDKMLELQMAGKGVRAHHVAEFEATETISDPTIKNLVMNSFKN
jgi:hypothetical protein